MRILFAVSRWFAQLVRRPGLSVALVGIIAVAMSVALSLLHMPEPMVHDEFSYLLAADTFARGRLTNPTHPMWVHFESFHIIHQPTYQSKYPPGQGLVLAAGQVVGGHPIVGVWISVGLACAAVCWMLWAWLPPRWAVSGGLLAALHPGILGRWGQSYMGGAVAMVGGALVFGSLRRIIRRPRARDALLMGLGLAVLANSRPFEGLVVSLPAAVVLLAWMTRKDGPAVGVSIRRIVLPILMVLGLTAGAMAFYNLRVTGNAFRLPYQVYAASYSAPFFQDMKPDLAYRHKPMRDLYTRWQNDISLQRSISGLPEASARKILLLESFYLGLEPLLTLVRRLETLPYRVISLLERFVLLMYGVLILATLPWVARDGWMRFALLTCGVLAALLLMAVPLTVPHYAAPITCLIFALVLQAMRHLCLWRWHGRRIGRFMVRTILVVFLGSLAVLFAQRLLVNPNSWHLQRARIMEQLEGDG